MCTLIISVAWLEVQWMTLSSANTACCTIIKCGWQCHVQTQLAVPSSNADDTVKCRHSLLFHHQIWMTLSSADTSCHEPSSNLDETVKCRHNFPWTIIKCGWHCQVQTQLAVPSSSVDDTIKCRYSLLYHHQMWMTLSSEDTACCTIIKCGWHCQVQTQLAMYQS